MSLKRLALGAFLLAFGILIPIQTKAADLGGNCCADLEERIADLEVTSARRGNRKMSVTVYGQVNKAVVFHDLDTGGDRKYSFGDGSSEPTLFGFMGEAKVGQNTKAGFKLEFGANELADNQIVIRHSAVWIENVQLGRGTIGLTSTATDGLTEISVANTTVANRMLNLQPVASHYLGGVNLPVDGDRRRVIRYDSPAIAGFSLAASWGPSDDVSGDVWDAALRYGGEFGGFRVAAGVGYRAEDNKVNWPGLTGVPTSDTAIMGSASAKHLASGLFVNVAGGRLNDLINPAWGVRLTGYHAQAGWEQNVFGFGNTTIFGEYADAQVDVAALPKLSLEGNIMGASIVQAIDSAAMDLYASWRRYEGGVAYTGLGSAEADVNTFVLGARVRF